MANLAHHRAELARIEAERDALRARHGGPPAGFGTADLLAALATVSAPGYGAYLQRDSDLYDEAKVHLTAINGAARAAKQAKINARTAAATQAAACNSCFTVHAGDCY